MAKKTLLRNARVFLKDKAFQNGDILTGNGKILEFGEHLLPDSETETLQMTGYTIYPGFINAHLHMCTGSGLLSEEVFRTFVRNGVTSVRDMGFLNEQRADVFQNQLALRCSTEFPRIVTTGRFICTKQSYGYCNPEGTQCGEAVETAGQAGELVDWYASLGCSGIKTAYDPGWFPGENLALVPDEILKTIFRQAKANSMWVSAHITRTELLGRFLQFGDIEAAHIPFDTPMSDIMIRDLVQRGICITPCIVAYEHLEKPTGVSMVKGALENLARYYNAGGRIATGNDMVVGEDHLHEYGIPIQEMRRMHLAGMRIKDIIYASTVEAARTAHIDRVTGSIGTGKSADLIAVADEPDASFEVFRHIPFVMNRGDIIVNHL